VALARCELAAAFPGDLRRIDAQMRDTKKKLAVVVRASGTTLTGIFGGPVIAATMIGYVADASRFPSRDRFAAADAVSRRWDRRQPGAAYNDKAKRQRGSGGSRARLRSPRLPPGSPENRPTPAVPPDDFIRRADNAPDLLGRERQEWGELVDEDHRIAASRGRDCHS
jgi:hypothetical protein